MGRLNIAESRIRKAGGWVAERIAQVKLDVDDDSHGDLRRLERLEAVAVGIGGKIALWRSLDASTPPNDLNRLDYARLVRRAEEQRARVEVLRLQAAHAALTT